MELNAIEVDEKLNHEYGEKIAIGIQYIQVMDSSNNSSMHV